MNLHFPHFSSLSVCFHCCKTFLNFTFNISIFLNKYPLSPSFFFLISKTSFLFYDHYLMAFSSYLANAISSFIPLKIINSFLSKFILVLLMSLPLFPQSLLLWLYVLISFCQFRYFSQYLSFFGTHKDIVTSVGGSGLKRKDFIVRPPDKDFCTFFFFLSVLSGFLRWISQSLTLEYKSSTNAPSWGSVEKKCIYQVDFHLNLLLAVHNSLPSSWYPLEQDLVQRIQ